jgi:hypothetical protein
VPRSVDFVFIFLHHPPVADLQTDANTSHNPRPNERSLTPGPDRTHDQERNDLPKDSGKGVDDEL